MILSSYSPYDWNEWSAEETTSGTSGSEGNKKSERREREMNLGIPLVTSLSIHSPSAAPRGTRNRGTKEWGDEWTKGVSDRRMVVMGGVEKDGVWREEERHDRKTPPFFTPPPISSLSIPTSCRLSLRSFLTQNGMEHDEMSEWRAWERQRRGEKERIFINIYWNSCN